jgi:hypothetical protein
MSGASRSSTFGVVSAAHLNRDVVSQSPRRSRGAIRIDGK